MNILALLFPLISYSIYYLGINYLSSSILSNIMIGVILGLYVLLMKQSTHRRMIALIHSCMIIGVILLKIDDIFLWVYQLGGLSIALSRHDYIQPLCPLPKTRMIIMSCLPLLWIILLYLSKFIPFTGICLAYLAIGLLMGFYLWMKERLNDKNRQLVTILTTSFMLFLTFFLLQDYQYMWMIWAIFSIIIQLFRVKFI